MTGKDKVAHVASGSAVWPVETTRFWRVTTQLISHLFVTRLLVSALAGFWQGSCVWAHAL
jgi:hypothetical protein